MKKRYYMALEFIDKKPSKKEIEDQIKYVLGYAGYLNSRFRFIEDFLSADRKYIYKIRGALSLKYQFKVLGISGTIKGLRERIKKVKNNHEGGDEECK